MGQRRGQLAWMAMQETLWDAAQWTGSSETKKERIETLRWTHKAMPSAALWAGLSVLILLE